MSTPNETVGAAVPEGARCALHGDRHADFTCSRCGNFACQTCRHEGEGGGLFCEACSEHAFGDIPLERRAEIGLVPAIFRTITGVLLQPWVFFAQRSREKSLVPPMIFGVGVQIPGALLYAVVNAFTLQGQIAELRDNPLLRNNPLIDFAVIEGFYSPLGQVAMTLVSILFYPLFIVIFAGIEWLALFAVGARAAPFRELVRAISYFQATALVMVPMAPISLVLGLISPNMAGIVIFPYLLFWGVWLMIALWKVERTDLWRPVAAQGLLFLGCCCLWFGLTAAIMLSVAAAVGGR